MMRMVIFLSHALTLIALLLPTAIADTARERPRLGHQLTALNAPVTAPDFQLMDMDEVIHSLGNNKGKVVLVNFWATWCPPCRREMPSMERLYQDLKDKNFTLFAINQMEDPDHVFAYTGQLEVDPTFTLLFDTTSEAAHAYNVNGLPTTYLIDKLGKIRYRAVGGREFDHLEVQTLIENLINE
ncbi:MAG: TlpA disulfide reductase family protein [Gammaproteobacteria bacterium]